MAETTGISYYVTSDRYLDEDVENYPTELWGNNGRDAYADDAAVRARPEGLAGCETLIRETFRRYCVPMTLTEVHLGCTEEHFRWFMEMWQAAENSRAKGIDVRAVTASSLLGSFDWDSLVRQSRGHYEAAVFDIRFGKPRPTLLASALPLLANGRSVSQSLLHSPGLWRKRSRPSRHR